MHIDVGPRRLLNTLPYHLLWTHLLHWSIKASPAWRAFHQIFILKLSFRRHGVLDALISFLLWVQRKCLLKRMQLGILRLKILHRLASTNIIRFNLSSIQQVFVNIENRVALSLVWINVTLDITVIWAYLVVRSIQRWIRHRICLIFVFYSTVAFWVWSSLNDVVKISSCFVVFVL